MKEPTSFDNVFDMPRSAFLYSDTLYHSAADFQQSAANLAIRPVAATLRDRVESAIESLINLLDDIDGDADFEFTTGPDEREKDEAQYL